MFQNLNLTTLWFCFNDLKDMKQKESAPKSLKESNMATLAFPILPLLISIFGNRLLISPKDRLRILSYKLMIQILKGEKIEKLLYYKS